MTPPFFTRECTMEIFDSIFYRKTVVPGKLEGYGFTKKENEYVYERLFSNDSLNLVFRTDYDGNTDFKVYEVPDGEYYYQLFSPAFTGEYIGAIREELARILEDICDSCFEDSPFIMPQTLRLDSFLKSKFGDKSDRPFAKYPGYSVYRFPGSGKWYALVGDITEKTIRPDSRNGERKTEIVNVKIEPERKEELLSLDGIFPAYHMNKDSWVTIVLDGTLRDETLFELVSESRDLIAGKQKEGMKSGIWLMPANPKYYDVEKAFRENDEIMWKQAANICKGDIVYMYVAKPVAAIRYKCVVTETDIPYSFTSKKVRMTRIMRIRLIKEYPADLASHEYLKSIGITYIRGPRHATKELIEHLDGEEDI
ncbi:MAG: MmcQ/YjbR family DNA-binding protein [Oscillospiraceae bacterium]|nr:MmcQ/YjbR family DNA-binding protein [Oscillospiraceae bacterium]